MSKQRLFFSSPKFAVIGASKDQSKFGTKVLKWYKDRSMDVVPAHPKEQVLEGISTIPSLLQLSAPSQTSISIITPPHVTLGILAQAKELSIPAIWLQPGAEDDQVVAFIRDNGLVDRTIFGGPCILVQGDGVRRSML